MLSFHGKDFGDNEETNLGLCHPLVPSLTLVIDKNPQELPGFGWRPSNPMTCHK